MDSILHGLLKIEADPPGKRGGPRKLLHYSDGEQSWYPRWTWRAREDRWRRYRFRGALAMFRRYESKDSWEREGDRLRYLEKICNVLPDELPEAFLANLETRPWMLERYNQLKRLCDFLELLEEADGVVKVVLEGKITITVVADGDTCDVEVTADVSLTSSIDGEAEGLYAFIAAEVVGRAICSDKAQGSGMFVIRIRAEATILALDGICHTEALHEVLAETVIVGEGIGGSVDGALAIDAGCDGAPGSEQIVMTEVVGHVEQGVSENGQTYADAGFESQQLAVGGRKLLQGKQQKLLSKYALQVLQDIANQQETSTTWVSKSAIDFLKAL